MDVKQQVEDELEVVLQDLFEHLDIMFQTVQYDSHQALETVGSLNLVSEYREWIDWSWDFAE